LKRDTILQELCEARWLKESCKRIGGYNDQDLYQEFMLVICQKTEQDLTEIYPYIKWWAVRTLINIANPSNTRKEFYKNFIHRHTDISEGQEPVYEHEYNHYDYLLKAKEIVMADTSIYWFDKELFLLYENGERYSTIAKRTKIYHKTVKESIEHIKTLIRKEYECLVAHCCDTMYGDNNS
jgi:hypothetical protein